MEPTFEEAALTSLFGGGASSLSSAELPRTFHNLNPCNRVNPAADLNGLIAEAAKDFAGLPAAC